MNICNFNLAAAILGSTLVAGCAGVTKYEIETPDGVKVKVENTKDYESYKLRAKKEADGSYSISLDETGVSASDPLKSAQDANSKLLDKVLGIVPIGAQNDN